MFLVFGIHRTREFNLVTLHSIIQHTVTEVHSVPIPVRRDGHTVVTKITLGLGLGLMGSQSWGWGDRHSIKHCTNKCMVHIVINTGGDERV